LAKFSHLFGVLLPRFKVPTVNITCFGIQIRYNLSHQIAIVSEPRAQEFDPHADLGGALVLFFFIAHLSSSDSIRFMNLAKSLVQAKGGFGAI
jgi:hypothetical protein